MFTPQKATRGLVLGTLGWLCLALTGCSSDPAPASPTSVLDRSLSEQRRTQAVEELPLAGPERVEAVAALNVLVWSDRHPIGLRIAAMDRLLQHDAEAFWGLADRWLMSVDASAMLAAIGDRAADEDRRELIPAWLRRWAMPSDHVPELGRVEYGVIRRLVDPLSIEEALWQRASDPEGEIATSQAAWTVLCRLQDEPMRRARLAEAPSGSPLIDDLRAAAAALDRLPTNPEGLRCLAYWRSDEARWARVTASLARIHADGHELRHIAVLSRLPRPIAEATSYERFEPLAVRFGKANRIQREVPAGKEITWETPDELSWPDWAVVWSVGEAMVNPAVVGAWFAQADADLADETTEHGGVLMWTDNGTLVARPFPPLRLEGDHKFFSSPDMIEAMYGGLAHYHFHAQRHDNAEFAGPGRGDLAFADAMETHTLILTFVDRDQLNVDLAFPGGRVLDLGCLERPTGD